MGFLATPPFSRPTFYGRIRTFDGIKSWVYLLSQTQIKASGEWQLPGRARLASWRKQIMPKLSHSYNPKAVLITGAAGFIGSNVCIRLVKNHPNCKFVVLDKIDYCANTKNLAPVWRYKNFFFVKGDIRSAELVNFLIDRHDIDTIYHFAAQTHVDNSYASSYLTNNCWRSHSKQINRFIHNKEPEIDSEAKTKGVEIHNLAIYLVTRYNLGLCNKSEIDTKFDENNSMMLPTNP
ncbi:hypothetical protein AAMO2058_000688400 [Amorphochlora amoebiformis]